MTKDFTIYNEEWIISPINDVGKAGQLHEKKEKKRKEKRKKLDHYLTPYAEINSKCIRELNIRLETTNGRQDGDSSKKIRIKLPCDLASPLLGIYPRI